MSLVVDVQPFASPAEYIVACEELEDEWEKDVESLIKLLNCRQQRDLKKVRCLSASHLLSLSLDDANIIKHRLPSLEMLDIMLSINVDFKTIKLFLELDSLKLLVIVGIKPLDDIVSTVENEGLLQLLLQKGVFLPGNKVNMDHLKARFSKASDDLLTRCIENHRHARKLLAQIAFGCKI